MKKYLIFVFIFCLTEFSFSQTITGVVKDEAGELLVGVNVFSKKHNIGTITNLDGEFKINRKASMNILTFSYLGFYEYNLKLGSGRNKYSIVLKEDASSLEEVLIVGKTEAEILKEKGFAINTLKTESFLNVPTDINSIIDNTPGVILRVNGGLGSSFNLAVNGLSGNHIKYFFDGVSMANWGSALSLNNFPVNLIERINIYKGVVPIHLGSDALGGAIDIRTASVDKKKLDISYTTGTFNTHRIGFTGQTHTKNNLFFKLSSFFNYSDNNYWMNNVNDVDDLGNILGTIKVKRFNDQYRSAMLSAKAGVINKKFADELTFNYSHAQNKNNIQHPDVSVNKVYGGLHTKNKTNIGYLKYKKRFKKLKIDSHFLLGEVKQTTIDTLSRTYNWLGEYTVDEKNTSGEYYNLKSIFHVDDNITSSSTTLEYKFSRQNVTNLNFTTSSLERNGYDEINENNNAFENPNKVRKNIIGLSHETKYFNDDLTIIGFVKNYWFDAEINQQGYDEYLLEDQIETTSINTLGYGITSAYSLLEKYLVKFSYEKAYRLPVANEILGNGFLTLSNKDLNQEESDNINLEFQFYNQNTSRHLKYETNLFFRNSKDFIRPISTGIYTQYINEQDVRVLGVENNVRLKLNDKYDFSTTITYQSLTSQTEFDEGLLDSNYKSRIPNIPYFFGNLRAGVNFLSKKEDTDLKLWFTSRYTNDFFLYWESLGNLEIKNKIPTQFINDIDITYSIHKKYNISASLKNIFDAESYDNFNIQKPGRAFYLKLRYFLQ